MRVGKNIVKTTREQRTCMQLRFDHSNNSAARLSTLADIDMFLRSALLSSSPHPGARHGISQRPCNALRFRRQSTLFSLCATDRENRRDVEPSETIAKATTPAFHPTAKAVTRLTGLEMCSSSVSLMLVLGEHPLALRSLSKRHSVFCTHNPKKITKPLTMPLESSAIAWPKSQG